MSANHLGILPRDWEVVFSTRLNGREAVVTPVSDLPVSSTIRGYLDRKFPGGIYQHQHEAVSQVLLGQNVCLATATASGKTLAFTTAALELLATDPRARVLAIYPQRALANEQEQRWRDAVTEAGIGAEVCRIDGSVPTARRSELLRRSRVIIMTPDVMHAWLLSRVGEAQVRGLIANLSLIVVDEVHTYTGVVGSNAAFLFRRLHHCAQLQDARPRFFCSSATIRDPERHLEALFGVPFHLIGPDADTSPRHPIDVYMVNPPGAADSLTEIAGYLSHLVDSTNRRFVAFVDSRKQTEHIASILGRKAEGDRHEEDTGVGGESIEAEEGTLHGGIGVTLESASVLPYRAGYEERDRDIIQRRLSSGSLRGVVSTSALELGIDVPHLDTAVLVGVPRSSTSLFQRIGRVGRHGPGIVVVVNTGDVYDEAVFRTPEELLRRPPAEGALYLENSRIQYIHALCLARFGGEHDQVSRSHVEEESFMSPVTWPDGFLNLCVMERTGQVPVELQSMKSEAGDSPNYTFPLRDVESQFQIELVSGPNRKALGSVSYAQALREAYPGAVYLYATNPHRVTSVSSFSRRIRVRRERHYATQPTRLPTLVFPNLTFGNVLAGYKFDGDLHLVECNLQIREAVAGLKERRGSKETTYTYPLTGEPSGIRYDAQRFTRNYFTTGALLFHPLLTVLGPEVDAFAALLFEALLIVAPFERQDVGFSSDKMRAASDPFGEGTCFVAVFDQTYGSLRLSGRMLELDVFRRVMETTVELARNGDPMTTPPATVILAETLYESASSTPLKFSAVGKDQALEDLADRPRVIMPGSRGLNMARGNIEFIVERVVYNPRMGALTYVGRHHDSVQVDGQVEIVRVDDVIPIPGESELGIFDYDLSEVVPV